jgi:DNA-binding winged helix-turn-helix (wHTH) protein
MNPNPKSSSNSEPIRLSAEPDFAVGDLVVRPSLRQAIRDGRTLQLEPRVMQVLVALVSASGAVVSRDDLILRCWEGRIVGEAAINRCICKLREFDGASLGIETIARVGYRLTPANGTGGAEARQVSLPAAKRIRFATIALLSFLAGAVLVLAVQLALKHSPVATRPMALCRQFKTPRLRPFRSKA